MRWSDLTGRLEAAEALDPAVEAVTGLVDRVLPVGPVKDALHGRWLGHQLHPVLVALPIGMFSSVTLLDLTGGAGSRKAARRLVGAGVVMVAPTAAAGFADWSALGAFHRPRRVGLVHASANVLSTLLYSASWMARRQGHQARGRTLAMAGLLGLSVGGYLGGHLAYSEGVGVNRNADEQKEPVDWTDAAGADDLQEGQLRRVEVAGQAVLLVRRNGDVYAIGATCSHYGGPLDEGQLEGSADPCVQCPWHGSRFRLSDGSVARGPATVPQLSYDVRTVGDRLQVKIAS
jgi:nitrite reductase/ring-hydroxylating ferredoxin subunit/uncharacterized membrane protein